MSIVKQLDKTMDAAVAAIEDPQKKLEADFKDALEKAAIEKKRIARAQQAALDAAYPRNRIEPVKQIELASSEEISAVLNANPDVDFSLFDPGERDHVMTFMRIQRDDANARAMALERMRQAFPEIDDQNLFGLHAYHERDHFISQITHRLYLLAQASIAQVMEKHVVPFHKFFGQFATVLEKAADAQTEKEHREFTVLESERESQARSVWQSGARSRYLRGLDDHKFNFVPRTFKQSSLPERLVATAKALREFRYTPKFGPKPSEVVLNGLLALALTSHPGK